MQQRMEIIEFNEKLPMRLYCYRLTELKAHWHNGIEIILILKGECSITVNDKIVNMKEDDIILVNDNNVHELKSEKGCNLIALLIDTNKIEGMTDRVAFDLDSTNAANKNKFYKIKRYIAELVKVNSSDASENNFFNRSVIYAVLYELSKNFKATDHSIQSIKYIERLNEILDYIERHYKEGLTFNQIATAHHLSVPYLSSFFKRYLGVNFQTYYNNFRLERAVNQLLHSDCSIEQIAFDNGYPNPRAFVTSFKAKYDTLPSIYRKNAPAISPELSTESFDDELDKNSAMSLLTKYLPKPNRSEPRETDFSDAKTVSSEKISLAAPGTLLKHNFRKFTSVGRAKELLLADVQEMLSELQSEIGFEYIKFHGLLSDDMLVYTEDENGNPKYSFMYIDKVFDFLQSIHLKPLVQFSFMPKALSLTPERTAYVSPYVLSMPKNMQKWENLVAALTNHLIERYGFQTVKEWLFCCWNEPDTSVNLFGFQNDEDFYALYKATYDTVKSIDKRLTFGSPSLLISYNINQLWCKRYIAWCKENDCVPDFMNIHYYDNDFADGSFDGHRPAHPLHSRLNRDEDSFSKCIRKIKNMFDDWGIGSLPIYLTEWNLTVSHRNLLSDTCFKSCYLAKNLLENYDTLDSFGYWVLTDMIEETLPSKNQFHGGLGLYTYGGIKKPHYFTFRFVNRLGDKLIAKNNGYFITKSHRKIQIIAYNYEHFNHLFAQGESFDMQFTERYTPFNQLGLMDLSLEFTDLKSSSCIIREQIVNQTYGSAFDEWIRMGAQPLSNEDIAYLKSVSVPKLYVSKEEIVNDTLTYHASLEPLEVRLIEIELSRQ
ncbi:MAG: helix-turn-helix domain-containing protein [Clostridia bacterium]|nr:helix-turn-helix domain-containing protein [Clostridia bacterium]